MSHQHIETLIIGAGQAGLATAYQLGRLGPRVPGRGRQRPRRRQLAVPLRLAQALLAGSVRRPPGDGLPGRPVALPGQGRGRRLPRAVRRRPGPAGAAADPGREGRAPRGRRVHRTPRHRELDCDNVVVASGTFGGRDPQTPEFAARRSTRDPAAPLDAVPKPEPVAARADARGRCLALGLRHRLRAGRALPDDPGRSRSRQHPAGLGVAELQGGHPGGGLPLAARAHPAHPDGPQGDGQGPAPRRAPPPGSRRTTSPSAGWNGPSTRSPAPRTTGARCSPTGASSTLPTSSGRPGSGPTSRWIDAPIAGDDGWPREYRGVVDGVPGLYFCGLSFQYAFSSMVFPGVARDSAYVARRIAERAAPARAVAA